MAIDSTLDQSKIGVPRPRHVRWTRKVVDHESHRATTWRIHRIKHKLSPKRICVRAVARFIDATGNRIRTCGLEFAVGAPVVTSLQKFHLYFDKHEFDEVRLLKEHLDPSLPTVEFGGSMGVVACITNRRLRQPTDHVVVEANPRVVPVLEENRRINECQFDIIQAAVGYGSDTVDFHFGDDCMTGTTCRRDRETTTVPTITLESILEARGFDRINLIVDIEGSEIAMVVNELETIRRHVQILILETHERYLGRGETAGMIQALEDAGLEILDGDRDEPFVFAFRNRNLDAPAADV